LNSDDITAATMTASGNVIVQGNLTVNGTTTTVNSNTVNIGDNMLVLNSDEAGTPSQNAGFEVERGTSANVSFFWDEANDRFSTDGDNLAAGTFVGALTGNVTGNASTATKLATARTIGLSGDASGSVSFDGSANATITVTVADDSHNHTIANIDGLQAELDGKLTAGATSGNGISGSASSGTFTVTSNATSANTASTTVFRDGSGNFSAGTITATLSGTATNANNLYINNDDTGDTNCPILFSANSTAGYKAVYEDSGLYFNNTSNTLVTTLFQGTATSARYADLAEMYAADGEIEPGTVVCFGGDAEVTVCNHDMDRKVAGVVSTNPAYLMNSEAEGVAVALTGRVPCKVTGPVAKGDMLVSAGNGMARAEENPAMGSVIGKALGNNEDGEGIIEVVVGRL
jgi:hypothetical protein